MKISPTIQHKLDAVNAVLTDPGSDIDDFLAAMIEPDPQHNLRRLELSEE